jgi:hypothetical protein
LTVDSVGPLLTAHGPLVLVRTDQGAAGPPWSPLALRPSTTRPRSAAGYGEPMQISTIDPLLPKPVRPPLSPARAGTAQIEAASWVVRSGPFRTAVNGTLVARPARDDPRIPWRRWLRLGGRVRFVLGDHLPCWQAPAGRATGEEAYGGEG